MSERKPNIMVPVDLTNPGQFFACCGLLELADRLWLGAEGWFEDNRFLIVGPAACSLPVLLHAISKLAVSNTMTPAQNVRLAELSAMSKKEREEIDGAEDEKAILGGMRRKEPIVFDGPLTICIDWFCDPFTRGFSLKTWAGQQSVLDIANDMFVGMLKVISAQHGTPWAHVRGVGLPFNFDSDLGAQGSGLDIGFSFDKLEGNKQTRVNRGCSPAIEFLCFIGLQRFRPLEIVSINKFRYSAWCVPLEACVAAAATSSAISTPSARVFEFSMFQRSKDYYSFYPAVLFQGDRDE